MLFDTFASHSLQLANHMVMAPLTRSRATPEHMPNALMATYYGQRATAGLIITEIANLPPGAEVLGSGATVEAIGRDRVGIRLSPYGVFNGTGGFDHGSAEQALLEKRGDLIAFGRPFLANPDLVARMHQDAALNTPDAATFYVSGAKGYSDYPVLAD